MKIGVFGTGVVGQTLAGKLSSLGHDVRVGTRSVEATLAAREKNMYGNPPFRVWLEQQSGVSLGTMPETAAHGEILLNALSGRGTLEGLGLAGADNLADKVLIDISNALDFSRGMPPTLFVCDTDSLGEQVQREFPRARVVKTLNTVTARLMIEPGQLAGGDHTLFLAGNDAGAKQEVSRLLEEWFGWRDIIDLGDISMARGVEMLLPLWVRLYGALRTPIFSFKVVR